MKDVKEPTTLQEAIIYFSNPEHCREYLIARRWPDRVTCPRCGSKSVAFQSKHNRWQCAKDHDRRQFTLKTGTIFEDSPIGLDKWLAAMWQVVNCKNGISSYEVHRTIGVTQKTAWFMDHRICFALGVGAIDKLSGEVEADETFIGGKARNMHLSKHQRRITVTGGKDKTAVMGILERGVRVRNSRDSQSKKKALQAEVTKHVEAGSAHYTDALLSHQGLAGNYAHQVVDPAVRYVDGKIHTSGLENFWSLVKRGINGTYISVEPFHLFRYLDEQTFRYNHLVGFKDGDRFDAAVRQVVGKRLTLDQLTGKNQPEVVLN